MPYSEHVKQACVSVSKSMREKTEKGFESQGENALCALYTRRDYVLYKGN